MPSGAANVSELFVSFQGEGVHAGRRHLFVRFAGCPLRCRWCDTPDSLLLVAEVGALRASSPPLHAMAVTGGEPLAQVEFLVAWLQGRGDDLPVLLETAGILPARLERVLPYVAIVSLDFKCPSNTGERARWDEHE